MRLCRVKRELIAGNGGHSARSKKLEGRGPLKLAKRGALMRQSWKRLDFSAIREWEGELEGKIKSKQHAKAREAKRVGPLLACERGNRRPRSRVRARS